MARATDRRDLTLSAAEQRAWIALQDIPDELLRRTPGAKLAAALGITRATAAELIGGLRDAGVLRQGPDASRSLRRAAARCTLHNHEEYEPCDGPSAFRIDCRLPDPYARRARTWYQADFKSDFAPMCIQFFLHTDVDDVCGRTAGDAARLASSGRDRSPPIDHVYARPPADPANPSRGATDEVLMLQELYALHRRAFQPNYRPGKDASADMVALRKRLLAAQIRTGGWRRYMAFIFKDFPAQTRGALLFPPTRAAAAYNSVDRFVASLGKRKLDGDRLIRMLRGAGHVEVEPAVVASMAVRAAATRDPERFVADLRDQPHAPDRPEEGAENRRYAEAVAWLVPRLGDVGHADDRPV